MNSDGWFVVILLIINFILALIYLIWHLHKKSRNRGWLNFLFMLIFPAIGFLFLTMAKLIGFLFQRLREAGIAMAELSFDKKRTKLPADIDVEEELNTVPIEEVMIVADKNTRRNSLINVLKTDDYKDMMSQLQDSVENDDMEVAHYAATFITDTKARFKAQEAKMRVKVENDSDEAYLDKYISFMVEDLDTSIFSKSELNGYATYLDKAMELLNEKAPEKITDKALQTVIDLWLKVGNTERSDRWIPTARDQADQSLVCFKLCANYYFRNNDKDGFFRLLKEVRSSSIYLDNEALEWIRFFKDQT